MAEVVAESRHLVAQAHHLLIIFSIVRSECEINVGEHGVGSVLCGSSEIVVVQLALGRKQFSSTVGVLDDLLIHLVH